MMPTKDETIEFQRKRIAYLEQELENLMALQALDETDHQNIGAQLTAMALLKILKTGEHPGTFGGEKIEEAAQAILELHREIKKFRDGAFDLIQAINNLLNGVCKKYGLSDSWDEFTCPDMQRLAATTDSVRGICFEEIKDKKT